MQVSQQSNTKTSGAISNAAANTTAAPIANPTAAARQNIVELAAGAPNFSTLTSAIKAAGLEDTLKADGPFTVFAPTDAAFKKLAPGVVDSLLQDKTKLRAILEYHVVMGKIMAKDVTSRDTKTVQGGSLKVSNANGAVTVNDAKVVQSDIEASNGVIHGIDTIVMPRS